LFTLTAKQDERNLIDAKLATVTEFAVLIKPGVIFRNSDWLGAQCAATLRIFAARIPARSTARPTDLGIDFGTEL